MHSAGLILRGGHMAAHAIRACIFVPLAVQAAACTNSELRCIAADCQPATLKAVDNVASAAGTVCTQDPNASTYPYKILLVVDTSASTAQSDPPSVNGREKAVLAVLNDPNYMNNPAIQFAIMTFDSSPTVQQGNFVPNSGAGRGLLLAAAAKTGYTAIDSANGDSGQTDYVLALKQAAQLISADVAASPAADVPYTKYDVQWLSDGFPEVGPDCPGFVCQPTDAAGKAHCGETLPIVKAATQSLLDLQQSLGFFSISLSTVFLDAPLSVVECSLFQAQDKATWGDGPAYLMQMAAQSTPPGTYQSLSADKLKFTIHATTITRRFVQNSFYLVNYSRVVKGDKIYPDSDQDGLADEDEDATFATLMTDKAKTHSVAGSMCSDLIRTRSTDNPGQCDAACTPTAQAASASGPAPTGDPDGDGLLSCEEGFFFSNPQKIDSDGDDLTDDIEARFHTDPLDPKTSLINSDGDGNNDPGMFDRAEIYKGLNPKSAQSNLSLAYVYTPLVDANSPTPGVSCYTFRVDNVQLAETIATSVSARGDNKLCLLLVQHTIDNPSGQPSISRACKTANYQVGADGVGVKVPADGALTFQPSDFSVVMCPNGNCTSAAMGAAAVSP